MGAISLFVTFRTLFLSKSSIFLNVQAFCVLRPTGPRPSLGGETENCEKNIMCWFSVLSL